MNNEPSTMNYQPVIGLEVHVELKTKSKMFCRCAADYFGKEPNTYTCPVCLGMPGALPYPNKTAIDWCVMIGLALNCEIPLFSKFDRKNYFYPDLAKGYQISQYDKPFCLNGWIDLSSGKKIGITRVHMEEDTGKLTHVGDSSLIDFNRSGIPLVEIVTDPDFTSAEEVVEYLKKLQQIVRYLDVSNADMEKGDMRLEPNISLRITGETGLPKYKVEVKNINSFRFVDKAIQFELKRQQELLEKGEKPTQETRGWDENKQKTVSQRTKEEANDYRYFPDPDLPPIRWEESQISNLKSQMCELPDAKLKRFVEQYKLSNYDAEILTRDRSTADYFEGAVKAGNDKVTPKQLANEIINKKVDVQEISVEQLVKQVTTSSTKETIDEKELSDIIGKVLTQHATVVQDFKNGKENAIMFLIGQVMKTVGKKIDATVVRKSIENKIKNN